MEILFRAKRTADNKWVYGMPSQTENTLDGWAIDYKTIGQFTGLYDKNDEEIFDGDILHFVDEFADFYVAVFWDENTASYRTWDVKDFFDGSVDGDDIMADFIAKHEIVGNIYDNHEWLEKGEVTL